MKLLRRKDFQEIFARSILIPYWQIFTEHLNQFSSIMVAAHWKDSAVVMSGCGHRGRSSMSSLGLRANSPREEPPDSPGAKFCCIRFVKHQTDWTTGPNRLKTQHSPLLLSQTSQACIRITPQSTVRDWCCRNDYCRAALTWTGPDRAVLVLPMCVAAE